MSKHHGILWDCFIGIFLDIKLTESTQFWWNTQPVYFFACVCQMGKKKHRSGPALRSCHQKLAVEAGKMIVQPSVRIQQEWGVTHRIQGLNMRYFCRIYADSCWWNPSYYWGHGTGITNYTYIYIYVCVYSSYNYSKNGYLLSHQTWLECWIFPALSASIDRSIAGTSSLGTKSRCSTGAVAVAVVAARPVAGAAPGVSGRSSCSSTSFSRSRAEDRRAMGLPWEMPT